MQKLKSRSEHKHMNMWTFIFSILDWGCDVTCSLSACWYDFPTAMDYKPELGPKINPLF